MSIVLQGRCAGGKCDSFQPINFQLIKFKPGSFQRGRQRADLMVLEKIYVAT